MLGPILFGIIVFIITYKLIKFKKNIVYQFIMINKGDCLNKSWELTRQFFTDDSPISTILYLYKGVLIATEDIYLQNRVFKTRLETFVYEPRAYKDESMVLDKNNKTKPILIQLILENYMQLNDERKIELNSSYTDYVFSKCFKEEIVNKIKREHSI